MTAPVRAPGPRSWSELALEAPRLAGRRQAVRRVLLPLVAVPGLWLLYGLTIYGLRFEPALLAAVTVHLLALAACWLPPRSAPAGTHAGAVVRLGRLRLSLARRMDRMALVRRVVTIEALVTFAWPLGAAVLFGSPVRWSGWFTLSLAILLVLRPLELIVRAETREGNRLLRRTLDPSR